MRKRISVVALLLTLVGSACVQAIERPTLAILPFGIAKDRKNLRWLGPATTSSLTEKLRRIPLVRVLPVPTVVSELIAAGIQPENASWAPAVATQPLGHWLGATILVIGAVGHPKDRSFAEQILQIPEAVELVGIVAVGHPAPDRPSSSLDRPKRDDVVRRNSW